METTPIIFPHELLSFLFEEVKIHIPQESTEAYWRNARSANAPWAMNSMASNRHHPCGLYGDAARLSTQYQMEKQVGLFFNLCLWRPRSIRASRFLLWNMEDAKLWKNRTCNAVLRIMVWSLRACFAGRFPTHDWKGRDLRPTDPRAGCLLTSAGDCFTVTELRGDWEWHKQIWRFRACSWKSINPCFLCPCSAKGRGPMLYHTVGPDAEPVTARTHLCAVLCSWVSSNNL